MHPVLFKLGPVTIYSYGVMLASAFIISALLISSRTREFGIPRAQIMDFFVWVLIGGILGARVLYVLTNLSYFWANPVEIIMLHHGGLVFFGGLGGGLLGGVFFIKKRKLSFANITNLIAPYILLGQAIGKIGCLLNGCCYGRPTHLPFAVLFPGGREFLHPTQVYEALAYLILFLFLRALQARSAFRGNIFLLYLIFYSIVRFFIEYFRADSPLFLFGLTLFQLISLAVVFIAVAIGRLCRVHKT